MWSKELNCDAKKTDDKHFFYFKLNFSFTIKFKSNFETKYGKHANECLFV